MYRSWVSLTLMLALAHPLLSQTAPSLTPESLKAALKAKPSGTQAEQLAEQIRQYFGGKESLQKGPPPKVEGRRTWRRDAAHALSKWVIGCVVGYTESEKQLWVLSTLISG
jgi:hypothetical protein